MYERILVALDGSEQAERVLAHVVELAQKFGSEVHLLRATTWSYQLQSESMNPQSPELGMDIAKRRGEAEREEAERYLVGVAGRLKSEGVDARTIIAEGPPDAAILAQLRATDASLLAMTTHGRGNIGRLVFGSVADAVVRKSETPVLLVRVS